MAVRWLYNTLLTAVSPVLAGMLFMQARRGGGGRFLRERFGRHRPMDGRPLWVHCASVGEVRTARPLLAAIRARRPELPLLVTTATTTGAAMVERIGDPGIFHAYLPVDWPRAVRRFFRAVRPRGAVIMETELWPNLLRAAALHGCPVILANARLSRRSVDAAAVARKLQAEALRNINRVLARSEEDAARFLALGVDPARLQTLGSLKLAEPGGTPAAPMDLGRPFLVAASTHEDEELRVAEAWAAVSGPSWGLLVIAPRHPQRGPRICHSLLGTGLKVALRSAGEPWQDADIYVADTLGELEEFMAGAELVFVGGSLIPHGGQNIVEPARLGRPVLFGPYMENFAEESRLLLNAGGARRVAGNSDLVSALRHLLADPEQRRAMGEAAAAAVASANDVAGAYADQVLERVDPQPSPEAAGC